MGTIFARNNATLENVIPAKAGIQKILTSLDSCLRMSEKLIIIKSSYKGMSLIELLIALVISSILMGAMYQTFIKQQKTYAVQEQVSEAQQNVRIAMDTIVRYVRMAGYKGNPAGAGSFGFLYAKSDTIGFTFDADGNGLYAGNDSAERIEFRLSGTTLQRTVNTTTNWQDIAENIESIQFQYLDANNNTTTILANIRRVIITITGRTSISDPELGIGGGYRRRTLTSSVQVRNLGL